MTPGDQEDDFYSVPRLEADGTNWPIYRTRLVWAMEAQGVAGHLLPAVSATAGTSSASGTGANVGGSTTTATAATVAPFATGCLATISPADPSDSNYRQHEAIARHELAKTVPDSILLRIAHKTTVAEMWAVIQNELESKTALMALMG